jgi:ubiquinone/menaquinone biosynthesis C-methylase UbiE
MSKRIEKGEPSAGLWQDAVRRKALSLCRMKKGRFLEVGCGEGLFLSQLASQNSNLEIYGLDNDSQKLSRAEQRLKENNLKNISLSRGDGTRLPYADQYFDVVVCINVFFNMPSFEVVKNTLTQMARVCKKEGIVIFDFRNAANPLLAIKYKLAPLYDATAKNLPLKSYRLAQFEETTRALNLTIRQKIYIGALARVLTPIIMLEAQKT